MKILLDGFNLGLRQGTGLATYTRELSEVLNANGYSISCLFGLKGIKKDKLVQWASFVQSLNLNGENGSVKNKLLFYNVFRYLPAYLFNRSLKISKVEREPNVSLIGVHKNLDGFEYLYNKELIFRVAQAFSFFTERPLRLSLPATSDIDIFHCTSPLPLYMEGVKNIVTIHDLIPISLPHSTNINLRHYAKIIRSSLRKVDAISVISQHTKNELINFFDVPEEKIFVTYQSASIPQAIDEMDENDLSKFLKQNYNLILGGYFLYYGAIEPKKNVDKIIKASLISQNELPLVIVGKDGWLCSDVNEQLERLNDNNRFRRLKYLPRKDLMMILKGAKALVFPSLHEGFGLPVLEAMNMGTPVITSDLTSLPEVGGDAPIYVDPLNEKDIAEAMDQIEGDEDLASQMKIKGKKQAKKFSKSEYFKRLEHMYNYVNNLP